MRYKIAAASSDGLYIDRSFGGAEEFLIYEVSEAGSYLLTEKRSIPAEASAAAVPEQPVSSESGCKGSGSCGGSHENQKNSCGTGRHPHPGGCGGAGANNPKVTLVEDCRCVICQKVGFQVQKQLEKRAIVSFDVSCEIEEALQKITRYFDRVDHHQSLRGLVNK